ncbi:hypothetical protein NE237_019895 [Protea cynaroides]|uniref:quinolinate synthase n=1 Tax=Protea cynaroides TaxID=273540 RepID=A0A9Q0H671_9MAGN|nr:hypothetical protein NE237_019895 [Protea cynaroides]
MAPPSLHVVYINTSLETKAQALELVPMITCTSSNAVQTILQDFAQIPNLNIWYGPVSYMSANIAELFQQMVTMTNEEIAEIHREHDSNSIRSLLPCLHYYQDGTCIVHDLFGHEIVDKIQEMYRDAFLMFHFEVPGEMFSLAMEAKRRGMGVWRGMLHSRRLCFLSIHEGWWMLKLQRHFQATRKLPEKLVHQIEYPSGNGSQQSSCDQYRHPSYTGAPLSVNDPNIAPFTYILERLMRKKISLK